MTERAGRTRWALTGAVAIAALLLALFASGRAREALRAPAEVDLAAVPPLPSPLGDRAFWIGGWVGPPPGDRSPETWRAHAAAGLDVSMGPLEDRYARAANVARLAFLDSLRAAGDDVPFVFVRDDSLHPDETTRPGWEDRIASIVRAYGGSRSLAGYFLADEPRPADVARWAPAARLLRRLDPAHPAYVNFVGLARADAGNAAAIVRWERDVAVAIDAGELALFTVDAYPFGPGEERPHFLATLAAAARVSQKAARPFGAVLQWTGHADLRAVRAAEARYQASQALAHGAAGITWFTYWTPDPNEEPWRWHGGAIAYDGARTARYDTLAAINRRVRALAAARGTMALRTAHAGRGLPGGRTAGALPRWVTEVAGGPWSLGWSAPDDSGRVTCVLVNCDRMRPVTTLTVVFAEDVRAAEALAGTRVAGPAPRVTVALAAGDATVLRAWMPPAPGPRTPSRSGTR